MTTNNKSTNPAIDDQGNERSANGAPVEAAIIETEESRREPDREMWSGPEDRQEFFLPVHGFVWFYPEEVEIIDHPAFQRLGSMHQLGMANLVYRGATHRRIEHSLGTVWVAQRMLEAVTHNSRKRGRRPDPIDRWVLGRAPTDLEKRFVRLAALLHDIGHVPYGHTIEDELNLLNKHDEEKRLDRIMKKTSWHGAEKTALAVLIDRLYSKYLPSSLRIHGASEIIKRIIIHQSGDDTEAQKNFDKSLAESGLRISICRDIVGNTICADLLDYLHRDWYHTGKPRHFDERILHYMEIRTPRTNTSLSLTEPPPPTADDLFVISIGNYPKLRSDGISAILDLLESRYQLAEAVLFHRTKMTATAMLERALSLVVPSAKGNQTEDQPKADQDIDLEGWLLDHSEEELLPALIEGRGLVNPKKFVKGDATLNYAQTLASNVMRRELYDLLLMVAHDQLPSVDVERIQDTYGDKSGAPQNRALALRLLENDFGLPLGSIAMYCPASRMNSKIAQVQVFVEGSVSRFSQYEKNHDNALSAGHLEAQLRRFKSLWRIGFFIDPRIKREKGEEFLSHLRDAIRCQVLGWYPRGEQPDTMTARIARSAVSIPTFHLHGCEPLREPMPLRVAQTDASTLPETYPTGARTLVSFISNERRSKDS